MSDQDFFFDEEDEKQARTEKTPAPKSAARKPSGSKPAPNSKAPAKQAPAQPVAGSFFEQSVNMGIAMLLVVIALLLGVVVGVLVGENRANAALMSGASIPAAASTGTSGGSGSAPALTQDQLKSGQLPSGHPSIGTSGSTSATGSTSASGN